MTEIAANSTKSVSTWARLPPLRGVLIHYGVAFLIIALALALRVALGPVLASETSYLFFLPAVLIASAVGGLGPGLFATFLGLLLGLSFAADFRALTAADAIDAAVFALVGVGVSWRGQLLRRFRRAATENAESALTREAHVKSILDSIPEAMIVIDERGLIQSFSQTAERLFGYTGSEVLGKNSKC